MKKTHEGPHCWSRWMPYILDGQRRVKRVCRISGCSATYTKKI